MALTDEMIAISKRIKPNFICLVPENRNEITTEGGLNLEKISKKKLKSLLTVCHSNGIELSAFINPNKKAIELAKKLKFQTVELHTGSLDKKKINNRDKENINNMINVASKMNLKVNIGHGLNFSNIKFIKSRKKIDTVHIGHFIISEAIFLSLHETIKKFQRII
jgi:pyridoxine 5-phosphate synthase